MPADPIIAEIHRIRERLWEECEGSAEEMARRLKRRQQQDSRNVLDVDEWKRRRQAEGSRSADHS